VPDYAAGLAGGVKGLRIGVPDEYFGAGLDAEIERAVRAAIDVAARLGAIIEPSRCRARSTAGDLLGRSRRRRPLDLARYDGVKYGLRTPRSDLIDMVSRTRAAGFGGRGQRPHHARTYALSTGYYDGVLRPGQKVRTLVRQEFEAAFARVTCWRRRPRRRRLQHGDKADPLAMYMNDVYTIPASMTGLRPSRCVRLQRRRPADRAAAHRARSTSPRCCGRPTPRAGHALARARPAL